MRDLLRLLGGARETTPGTPPTDLKIPTPRDPKLPMASWDAEAGEWHDADWQSRYYIRVLWDGTIDDYTLVSGISEQVRQSYKWSLLAQGYYQVNFKTYGEAIRKWHDQRSSVGRPE